LLHEICLLACQIHSRIFSFNEICSGYNNIMLEATFAIIRT